MMGRNGAKNEGEGRSGIFHLQTSSFRILVIGVINVINSIHKVKAADIRFGHYSTQFGEYV